MAGGNIVTANGADTIPGSASGNIGRVAASIGTIVGKTAIMTTIGGNTIATIGTTANIRGGRQTAGALVRRIDR